MLLYALCFDVTNTSIINLSLILLYILSYIYHMRQNQKSSEFINYFMYSNVTNTKFVISQYNHSFSAHILQQFTILLIPSEKEVFGCDKSHTCTMS